MECHSRLHPTTCAAQWPCRHVTPDVVRSCVLSKGDDKLPHQTLSDYVYSPKEMMACHVDVIQLCVLPKGDDTIAITNIVRTCVRSKGYDIMTRLMSCDSVCFSRVMMACHAQCCPTLYMLSNGDNGQPQPTVCVCQGP